MTRLPSGHRCIFIAKVDPEAWGAAVEGFEFAKFRAPRPVEEKRIILAQVTTRGASAVLAQDARRAESNALAPDATRIAEAVAA